MKVLSLLQPWASLIMTGNKKIETRSWNTKHRGPLLIHASAGKKPDHRSMCLDFLQEFNLPLMTNYSDLPFGAIIGMVDLIETFSTDGVMKAGFKSSLETNGRIYNWELHHKEMTFGDYSPGRYGWLLCNVTRFNEPIPAKGKLGLWEYDGEILEKYFTKYK